MSGDDACPVCKEDKLDGVHGGAKAGRACWVIPHTKCGGSTQGRFDSKFTLCIECDFYNRVREEEQGSFHSAAAILSILRK